MLKLFTIQRISTKNPCNIFQFSTEIKASDPRKFEELAPKYIRGLHRQAYSLKPGEKISNFEVLKIEHFPDFHITAYILQHSEAKIPFIHLDTADTSNCFALIFRTPALNNKGIGNIIEHMNFCGSKQYPIRDPFLHMSKRSLNEYSNAWNGPGYTCYPFCTNNIKDFYNLLGVYMDISFNPLMSYYDFLNEGWRLEFSSPEERKDLSFKGVCYDQMKVYLQMPDSIFLENIKKNLFKNNEYEFINGGSPEEIVKLSYIELMDYQQKFYHPSNCRLFSYGDMDFTKHLEFIDSYFTNKYKEKIKSGNFQSYKYKKTEKLQVAQNVVVSCPPNQELEKDQQSQFGLTFLCGDISEDPFLAISFNVLAYILFETPYSSFFQSLLASDVASGFCSGYGFDMSTREGTFTIGVKNVSEKEINKIEMQIMTKLQEIVKSGLDPSLIEMAINQIEMNAKLPKSDFGLTFLNNILGVYATSDDFVRSSGLEFLKSGENMKKFLESLKKKQKYFENLIQKYFIDNQHRVRLIMRPDNDFVKEEYDKEKKLIMRLEKEKTKEEKEKIFIENNNLKKELAKVQDVRCLPMLQLNEIPLQIEKSEYILSDINEIPFYLVDQPMNGTTFLRVKFDLSGLNEDLRKYLDLFAILFPKLGSKTINSDAMSEMFAINSSHFEVIYEAFSSSQNTEKINKFLVIQLAFLDRNIEKIMNSFTDLLSSKLWLKILKNHVFLSEAPDFTDFSNISQLLNFFASEKVNDLVENTLEYAISQANADVSVASNWNNQLEFVMFLSQMALNFLKTTNVKKTLVEISKNLEVLFDFFMRKKRISFIVHTNKENKEEIEQRLSILYHNLKLARKNFLENNEPDPTATAFFKLQYRKHYFSLPISSNHVIESFRIPNFTHPDLPKLRIFAQLFEEEINRELVEQGGAYGSGCMMNSNGSLSFYSFKDPHTIQTYESFERAAVKIKNGVFSEEELNCAKLEIFSKIDKTVEPQNKALNKIIYNIEDELWGNYRANLLNVTKEDVVYAANKYIIEAMVKDLSNKIIFGSSNNNLEGLLSKGWAIQRTLEDVSIKESNYYQNKDVKPILKYRI